MTEKYTGKPFDPNLNVELARYLGWLYGESNVILQPTRERLKTILKNNPKCQDAFLDGVIARKIEDAEKQKANKSS